MKKSASLLFIFALLFISEYAFGQDGYTKVKELGGIEEYRLESNDLCVLLMEDHSAPVLTFMVTYSVGSRNEVTGTTGATHLLEHLMFKGTDKYNREDGTGIDAMLQNRGAILNATTWLDRTNYYENLPSEHLELIVDIEADRMRNLWLREEDREPEMTVVRNEFERGENSPFSALNKEIWASAIIAHPYHHSTIGWRSDIEGVPIEKLREFYDTYYWPNNATVTVIGDFDKTEALGLIREYYGEIPSSPNPIPEVYTEEPEQQGARRVEVKRAGQLGVVGIGFKAPEGAHEDYVALSVLDNILTNGKTSRLYQTLVDPGKATNVFDFYFPFKDPSLFVTYAFLGPGATHEEVEQILWDQINEIKENGVTQAEVDRAITQITAQTAFDRDGSFSIASQINEAIAMGDWTFYVRYPQEVQSVTPQQIQDAVKTYFVKDKSTTGYFIPKTPGAADQPTASSSSRSDEEFESMLYYRDHNFEAQETGGHGSGNDKSPADADTDLASQINKTDIGDIEVYTMKTGVKDVITIGGSLAGGDWYSPESNSMIADMTGNMLDQGTLSKDKFQIAEELENLGASISFSVDAHSLNFNAKCLAKDLPKVMELLAEQLREPAFDAEELEKFKIQRKGAFQRSLENTGYMASSKLAQILYPRDHPNYQMPVEQLIQDIDAVTVEDLKKFHSNNYGNKTMKLVAVGDLNSKTIEQQVSKAFDGWSGGITYQTAETASLPAEKVDETVYMEEKTSVSVNMGIPLGIDEEHPDYLPLMLGTYILGGNFSARLMSTVRDKEGLTYGIGSNLSGTSMSDGHWALSATFAPNLLDQGMKSTMREVQNWIENGITEEELVAKKSTITGSAKVQLATTGGVASYIHDLALRGKSVSYADQYFKDIEAVTLGQVNRAIKKYIDLDRLVVVKAGTVETPESR
ncbi:insulinase family protein [Aliifodinibius sp. S!AR15-10]|uniref:M16 family metallopeptidase n=1 Tax=Aliifodinibius sp. S!AR15-10 TaxID=2950437 RepID=UPI002859B538|nr:pitrilysin family protein [Aliifodinibius sp. S!AR15-10]MDR8391592.1 insulinase family protein [Aliifodinibius sp. S!AR15-10]